MHPVIAVDFGGTHIRAALFPTEHPQPSKLIKIKTLASQGPVPVVERIVAAIDEIAPRDESKLSIGIASPGLLDDNKEYVLDASNLPGWKNFPLKEEIESRINARISVENDSKLAALGEYRFGAGQDADPMIYLTIGTGIGGALIINGDIYQGAHGIASEIGHMTVDPNGPVCSCGKRGHLEAIASGPAIVQQAIERIVAGERSILESMSSTEDGLCVEKIADAAINRDELALDLIVKAGSAIGKHLASLVHALNPSRVVIGGGMAQIGELLFNPIREAIVDEIILPIFLESVEVLPAELGDNSGLIGAMVLAREA